MSFEVQIRIYTIIQIIYTDGDCIEKKLYSTLGTDCKSFYIAIVHDIF